MTTARPVVLAGVQADGAAGGPILRLEPKPTPTAMVWMEPGRRHEAIAVPFVTLAPGDALVAIELATICGSDVHTTQGHRASPAPLVLGHEQVGHVTAVGHGAVTSDGVPLQVGARVVWSLTIGCGHCPTCNRGLPQKCATVQKYGHERLTSGWELNGGFATHVHVRAGTAIVAVPDSLPAPLLAPIGCGTATAVAALAAATAIAPITGSVVVVYGAGLIGLTACAMATDRGARVIVVDPVVERRNLALRFGAAETADPMADQTDGESLNAVLRRLGDPPLVAVEASGTSMAVSSAIETLGLAGVAVMVGSVSPSKPIALDPENIVRRLVSIRGVHNYAPRHLEDAVEYITQQHDTYPFAELVGTTVDLPDLDAGLTEAAGAAHVRVGVRPRR